MNYEKAPDGARFRVVRGASWVYSVPLSLRSAYRGYFLPGERNAQTGFRVVLDLRAN